MKNTVQLIGYLGADPEIRRLDNGNCMSKVSLATSYKFKNANGELMTNTQWHKIIFWNKLAENAQVLLKKGSLIELSGRLEYNKYEDSNGNPREVAQVVASSFLLLQRATSDNLGAV